MKINLIIDSNNIFYSSTDLTKFAKKMSVRIPKTEKLLASKEAVDLFIEKIDYDITMLLQTLKVYDEIYLVQDSSSWRKKVLINGEYSYKKNRKSKNQEIDWEGYEKGVAGFLEKNDNIKRFKVDGLEGDDLVYLLNETLLEEDETNINIIISTDSDFKQLLKPRTLIYNQHWKNPKFVKSPDWDLSLIKTFETKNKNSNYNLDSINDMFDVSFLNIKNKPKSPYIHISENFTIDVINRWEGICTKLLTGDDKDNVPSIYSWKKPDKIVNGITKEGGYIRVTPKYIKKIWETFKERNIDITPKNMFVNFNLIYEILEDETKQILNKRELMENLKRNYLLLVLSKKNIPEPLTEKYKETYTELVLS